ncbi:sugar-binding protein [Brachybacterium phenoliresistens]|uniref:Sugar-binding protein n=1 Tax=Brachybacterium phenoliresistens TaxID=396014 RepID=Z9JUY8_9MICO|nr:extracellular solute-binding protein [Brachybacterium phenoliresistens]EWS81591.1 sugar-binding protein [Brachybacterium phenoliresistens]
MPTPGPLPRRPRSSGGVARRTLLAGGIGGLIAPALLSACGPSAGGGAGTPGGGVSFTFWGPDFYQQFTTKMVDAFTAAHPEVPVSLQPAEWGGYWDKLAISVAGGTTPDVINMDGKYIAEYSGRGVLADLEALEGLDLSGIDDADLDAGRVDGTLTGISTGSNAWVVVVNPQLFADAGVEIPDDTTWTWDDYLQIATRISESGVATGVTGGGSYADLTVFLRQRGEDLWAADGMGCREESLAAWFQLYKDLQDSGATLAADAAVEDGSATLEQQAFSTARSAMSWTWTNQLAAVRDAAGNPEIAMLRAPSAAGSAQENGMFKKASMYWSIAADSADPDGAAALVDFLLNAPEAQAIQLLNRGVPSNPEAIEAMGEDLTDTDREVIDFLDAITPELGAAPAVQPMGTADAQNTFTRLLTDVRFGSATPAEAAAATLAEVNGMVEG